MKLRLNVLEVEDAADLRVTVNGRNVKVERGSADDWFECLPAAADLRRGPNTIEMTLSAKAPRPASWSDVMLEIRHADGRSR